MPSTGRAVEWRLIWCDPWLRALTCWLPLLLCGWMTWLFSDGLIRELPVGVSDQDHSAFSRQLSRAVDAHPAMQLRAQFNAVEQGTAALRRGDVYALVYIPADFEKQVRLGRQPQIHVFFNAQMLLVGRLLSGSLQQSLGTVAAQWGVGHSLITHPVPGAALGDAVPLNNQLTSLFNNGGNYAQFLVSALLPALWQILILVAAISLLARRHQLGLEPCCRWSDAGWRLIRCFYPLWLLYSIWGALMLLWFYAVQGWPQVGSLWLQLLAQGFMVLACLAMGALFFWVTRDGPRAMSLAAGYSAPAFAFMGVTFPVQNMDLLARAWRSLLPVAHYTELQIGQASLGITGFAAWLPLGYLLLFLLVWPLVMVLMCRRPHV